MNIFNQHVIDFYLIKKENKKYFIVLNQELFIDKSNV